MKRLKIYTCFLFFLLSLFAALPAVAQHVKDSTAAAIPAIERKAFEKSFSNGRINGVNSYGGTLASNNFDISFYRCEWQIDPAVRFIKGEVTSYFTITSTTNNIIFDLSDTLSVDSITYRGSPIAFQRITGDGLQLQFPVTLNAGQKDSVSVYYNGVPRDYSSFRPFVQTTHSGTPVIWTLSEPFGAKEWWPCKNGLNDKTDSLEVIITTPIQYRGSTNGVLFAEDSTAGERILHFKTRYPVASYLVAMAVTNYVVIKDSVLVGNRQMPLMLTTYPEWAGNAARINNNAKFSFTLLNQTFGDYPFAKEQYGHTAFGAGGGMEHQTNSFISTTDINLIIHELGHQWFGDKITCGSWEDIWLNEGFATYCQWLYYENAQKALYYPGLKGDRDAITALPGGSVRVDDTTNAKRIFDGRLSYLKGCYLLHMLRWILGDDVFFSGIKRYLNDPLLQYNYARTADLERNLEQESGKDLHSFFQEWFYGQGNPNYGVEWTQDSSNNLFLTINQSTSHPSVNFYEMPVPVQFKNSTRDTVIVFDHQRNGQTFLANPGFKADTAIFDPYYWLLCRDTIYRKVCTGTAGSDKIFPYYNIQWSQNSNNWSYVSIVQANNAATPQAENIPLYLHFSDNGKDTAIEIKKIRYTSANWYNIGFKATRVFVSTSCLMENNYNLLNSPDSENKNDIRVFPVPATGDYVNVSLKNPSGTQLSIMLYSSTGQLLYQQKNDTPGRDELFTINISKLPRGNYILRLLNEASLKFSRKIIRL